MVEEVLKIASAASASDVHLHSGKLPLLRVHGVLVPHGDEAIGAEALLSFLSSVLSSNLYAEFRSRVEIDSAFSLVEQRWRLHAYHAEHGIGVALRRLPTSVPSLADLGLPASVQRLATARQGLVLVTGATGSGKSTTAAALLKLIAHSRACHIVTIEDPIEYLHQSSTGVISQRHVGVHTRSFSEALRTALREDPDVIFVGEMRDLETISLALQAAETGHLVISTLHTCGAARAISRIVDVFSAERQAHVRAMVAETIESVISQELLPSSALGRVLVSEVLMATPSVRAMIREGKCHQLDHVMHTSSDLGMQTRARCLAKLRLAGRLGSD